MAKKVIEIKKLEKRYGNLKAVDKISFDVYKGEVFGLLGENGAGKTTTLEMIEGLRKPTSGKIKVLGLNIAKDLVKIKQKIGVQLQSSAYYEYLKLEEILNLFADFYHKNADPDKLLSMVDLKGKKEQYVNKLSGGQQQRFSIVASLINDPEIVFLDEPTTGLDPVARRNLWDIISKIKKQGKTIVLTTHYMEEAEILCDRIAIMDKGKIIAMDKTHKLIEQTKTPYKLEFILTKEEPELIEKIKKACNAKDCDLEKLPGKEAHFELGIKTKPSLDKAIDLLQKNGTESLTVGRASLEDLFIELTGRNISDEEEESV